VSRPLEGVRVVDFTHVMAGPFCTYFLALLGAEVIKVEPAAGDLFRSYGGDRHGFGMGAVFIGANAGKQSIALDLRQDAAKEVVRRLVAQADIVVESFRPGVIDKLGFGYEACTALKRDIIYCSVSGYGQAGPMRDYPAIDNVIQATSGMMSVNGNDGDPPSRVGVPAVDTYTATLSALAVLAAFVQRQRFGTGQRIDVAMMDASLLFLYGSSITYLIDGVVPRRTGNVGFSGQPTAGLFSARDGKQLSIGAVQQSQFEALSRCLGHAEWISDPRFTTVPLRRENAAALTALLHAAFQARAGEEWETVLSAAGVPCGLIRDVGAALELPQVRARSLVQRVHPPGGAPDAAELQVLNAGFDFAHDGPRVNGPPPRLGESTRAVLESLGYGFDEIDRMLKSGAAITTDG